MQKKRDFSNRVRKYWVPKFDGHTLTFEKFCDLVKREEKKKTKPGEVVNCVSSVVQRCAEVIRHELDEHGEFVLQGVGRFYLLHGKSGQAFVKFSSKYTR